MGYPTRIATCCYCGSRASLVLDRERHELTCASCGAPLHNMKKLRSDTPSREPRRDRDTRRPLPQYERESPKPQRRPYRKKRKGLMHRLFEEAFEVIEDILD